MDMKTKNIILYLSILLTSQSFAQSNISVFGDFSFDPTFSVVKEENSNTESVRSFFGSGYLARIGLKKANYSIFPYLNQLDTDYDLDSSFDTGKYQAIGLGGSYHFKDFIETGLTVESFKFETNNRADIEGYNLNLFLSVKKSITQNFYLNITSMFNLISEAKDSSPYSVKPRSLYIGFGAQL